MNAMERYMLDRLLPDLRANGFAVLVEPGREMLPSFMAGYRPDAIAIGPARNLAIEIKADRSAGRPKLDEIAGLFKNQPDWELRVYHAPSASEDAPDPTSSEATIENALGDIRRLISIGERRAALLMGWATFEAAGRRHLPEETHWPQTVANLLERLAFDGEVTPNEADLLRRLAKDRNRLAHGALDLDVAESELHALVEIIEVLLHGDVTDDAGDSSVSNRTAAGDPSTSA